MWLLNQGSDPTKQKEVDEKMKELDGTDNKAKLGANAILAVSLAVAKVRLKAHTTVNRHFSTLRTLCPPFVVRCPKSPSRPRLRSHKTSQLYTHPQCLPIIPLVVQKHDKECICCFQSPPCDHTCAGWSC